MNGQTDWVIPTITASASLLGAMVGGLFLLIATQRF